MYAKMMARVKWMSEGQMEFGSDFDIVQISSKAFVLVVQES